jgi:hypothetical protein
MGEDEILKEIGRRKQRAKDLNLRELLWKFYNSFLQYYSSTLAKEPEVILPAMKDSISIQDNAYRFTVEGVNYLVIYEAGKEEKESYGSKNWKTQVVTTPITLTLFINRDLVFEFKMKRTIEYTPDMPLFTEHMGDVTAFIDTPWVTGFESLVQTLDQHRRDVWDRKNAPRREQKLKEDMKRFGIS